LALMMHEGKPVMFGPREEVVGRATHPRNHQPLKSIKADNPYRVPVSALQ
jgi:hypothetical protein